MINSILRIPILLKILKRTSSSTCASLFSSKFGKPTSGQGHPVIMLCRPFHADMSFFPVNHITWLKSTNRDTFQSPPVSSDLRTSRSSLERSGMSYRLYGSLSLWTSSFDPSFNSLVLSLSSLTTLYSPTPPTLYHLSPPMRFSERWLRGLLVVSFGRCWNMGYIGSCFILMNFYRIRLRSWRCISCYMAYTIIFLWTGELTACSLGVPLYGCLTFCRVLLQAAISDAPSAIRSTGMAIYAFGL